jgi:ElaB/YqjD/DUF883 family membrane-anchored ribosome-binding protein
MSLTQTKGIEVLAILRGLEDRTTRSTAILEGEAGNPSNGLVTKVSRLNDEIEDLKNDNLRLKDALEKERRERQQEVKALRKELVEHGDKLVTDDKAATEKREERIRALEQWRWMMMGGAAAAGGASSFIASLLGG